MVIRSPDALADDPLWYKDAVIYETHVRAFADSNGDGMGDFNGLVSKLDYLQDLGITAIWLLPFYPSPLRDDGYDIADYMEVHPAYGSLRDFKRLLKEAHARGIRVITELIINHTSTEHPWFQRARHSPAGSKWRDFYVWSDTTERYQDTRIIFQDFETSNWAWDPVAGAYYWHRFYSHQPDLNFDNPEVRKAVLKVVDFWLGMGVDGMRLDAVPYLFERENTNCENLPETHAYLKELRAYIDRKYANRLLLAEANQWPEDAADYFGNGDECHMNFHFPLMPRMFMSLQLEDSFPIIDILRQTPVIPDNCQWAVFLRNHDELTLEMVTDEDRDYMYRVYASDPHARINLGIRRRLAPLLQLRRKVELLNGLLFSLPGTPVIYYGDEIGQGDNIYLGDRNGVRTPMQWSADRNAGFSRANPQKLFLPVIIDPEYHFEAINVEAQQHNPSSLLWWMKRLIALRKQYQVFGRGELELLEPENPKVLAFIRSDAEHRVLVVANLSRFPQYVELELQEHEGAIPVELFGGSEFPAIGTLPYLLTLGPYEFYWFALEAPEAVHTEAHDTVVPHLEVTGAWDRLFRGKARTQFERALPAYLRQQRWFRSKDRKIKRAQIQDVLTPPTADELPGRVLVVSVEYTEGPKETYVLPIAFATGQDARWVDDDPHVHAIARLRVTTASDDLDGVLYDATWSTRFTQALLHDWLGKRRVLPGQGAKLHAVTYGPSTALKRGEEPLEPYVIGAEQSNSSIIYGDRYIFKLYRKLEEGINPEVEMGKAFLQHPEVQHVPKLVGTFEYRRKAAESATLGILQTFVPNQGDGWEVTLDALKRYFENALTTFHSQELVPTAPADLIEALAQSELPAIAGEVLGTLPHFVRLLGQRTAETHIAMYQHGDDPDFAPEEFTSLHQRSLYQNARARLQKLLRAFAKTKTRNAFPPELREHMLAVVQRGDELDARIAKIHRRRIRAKRIRCHGDLHLGQVLFTGKDFVIVDFEGEPAKPLNERRFKRCPLYDVSGMLRSFDYAAMSSLHHGMVREEDRETLAPWAQAWVGWISLSYLSAYFETAKTTDYLPQKDQDVQTLLDFYLLDKCIYECHYELNNRPNWLHIPLTALVNFLEAGK